MYTSHRNINIHLLHAQHQRSVNQVSIYCTYFLYKVTIRMTDWRAYVLLKKSWTHTFAFTTFGCLLYLDYISCQEIRSSLYPLTYRVWAANWARGNREARRSVLHVSHRGVKCGCGCVCVCVCVCVCACVCASSHACYVCLLTCYKRSSPCHTMVSAENTASLTNQVT